MKEVETAMCWNCSRLKLQWTKRHVIFVALNNLSLWRENYQSIESILRFWGFNYSLTNNFWLAVLNYSWVSASFHLYQNGSIGVTTVSERACKGLNAWSTFNMASPWTPSMHIRFPTFDPSSSKNKAKLEGPSPPGIGLDNLTGKILLLMTPVYWVRAVSSWNTMIHEGVELLKVHF